MTTRSEAVAKLVEVAQPILAYANGEGDGLAVSDVKRFKAALAAVDAAPERDVEELRAALSDLAMAYSIDGHMGVPDLPGWFDALAKQAKNPHAEQENRHLARVFRAYLATWGRPPQAESNVACVPKETT